MKEAIDKYGWGSGASPLVTGRSELHAELERKLAEFEGTEAALLFPSGYAANVGTITALVGKGDAIYSDELNHASIIDGCRLSGAAVHVYPNQFSRRVATTTWISLETLLNEGHQYRRRLIVTDSIFLDARDLCAARWAWRTWRKHSTRCCWSMKRTPPASSASVAADCAKQRRRRSRRCSRRHAEQGARQPRRICRRLATLIDWLANRARPMFSRPPHRRPSPRPGLPRSKSSGAKPETARSCRNWP